MFAMFEILEQKFLRRSVSQSFRDVLLALGDSSCVDKELDDVEAMKLCAKLLGLPRNVLSLGGDGKRKSDAPS
jgi:hypothetical protein